ncbi:MAG: flagellar hook-basal body complex protein [Pseudomonadota bacterium]
MDNAVYANLNRQMGLLREMDAVSNNLANMSTTGYRSKQIQFVEHVRGLEGPAESLSMASAESSRTDLSQGGLVQTGGRFDFAVEGEGFFMLATPNGDRLTRAGSFSTDEAGFLVNPDGLQVLDAGGGPIAIPAAANEISMGQDGTLTADGVPIGQLGVFLPDNALGLIREAGVRFEAEGVQPIEDPNVLQGFLENSNVNPVLEVARMIEVQRAYEAGQAFLTREDERVKNVIQTLGSV